MKKFIILLALISIFVIIGLLFNNYQTERVNSDRLKEQIQLKELRVDSLMHEVSGRNSLINELEIIIDSLETNYEIRKEIVYKMTPVEKKIYVEKYHSEDTLVMILMNEERLFLKELTEIQKKEIQLLKTNSGVYETIIEAQRDVIKMQADIVRDQDKEIKSLKKQNRWLKIGAGAIVVLSIFISSS